jgi:hypothetical protein
MKMSKGINRRRVLRGMMGGAAVSVGLPMLDVFLNSNGNALASGAPLPLCFTSWFTGLGYAPGYWEPKTQGAGFDFGPHLRTLAPMKDKINIFSGMKAYLDAHFAGAHGSGPQCILQGGVADSSLPSLDQIIADAIGSRTRFRSIEVSCDGDQDSLSRRSATAINPAEPSPLNLYSRIFGPDFKDPNAADFTPDPHVMVRKSALSMVKEERDYIAAQLGASDRARLDEYFTSLRELEKRLDLELQKPQPLAACSVPTKGEEAPPGLVIDDARINHKLFADLIAHAFACGQTQVSTVKFSNSLSNLRKPGSQQTYHMYTHEESIDPKVGYQVNVEWFSNQCTEALLEFARTLENIKEGDGNLLDRSIVMYSTDGGYARTHSTDNIPMMTIGKAGGRLKTGIHVQAAGDTAARVGLTVMQALGVPIGTWGTESNRTSKTITEVMA